jgi:hypothetical protein
LRYLKNTQGILHSSHKANIADLGSEIKAPGAETANEADER